jgi:hypothetical protein
VNTQVTEVSSPYPERSRSLAFGGTFVLLAVLAACVAFIPHMGLVALSAIYAGAFLAYLGLRSDPQGGDLFEVIVPFSVLSFLCFCVGTMYLVVVPDVLEQASLAPFLLPALALATLGFLCFLVGYAFFFRTTAPSPVGHFSPKSVLVYLLPGAAGALGISVQRLQAHGMLNDQGISASISFIQQFGALFYFGWFLAWYMFWAKRLRRAIAIPLLATMCALAAVVLYFTFGGKGIAVTVLGVPALAYYEVKRRLPVKSILVIALIFVFLIFPLYNTFRRFDSNLDMTRRVDRTLDLASTWDSNQYLDASIFAFLKRISLATSVAAIVSDTGRWVDYCYGETLILTPISILIPRFVWPDKPNIATGMEFAETFRLKGAMDRQTYIAISMVGDFYWNFSLPGVVVGMWLLGMGYRWYYQRYGAGSGFDPIRKSIYFTLLPTALAFEGNVAIAVGGFVKLLIMVMVFLRLARRLGWIEDRSVV